MKRTFGKCFARILLLVFVLAIAGAPPGTAQKDSKSSDRKTESRRAVKRERADSAAFRARAERILATPEAARGYWGLLVEDADSGEILYGQNQDRYFTPASNAKMFTLVLALASLGPNYKFRTTLESQATVGENGVLAGDLALVGRGDPNLSNRQLPYQSKTERDGLPERVLAEMADALAARGVKEISGNIVGDDGYFAGGEYPSGWAIDDMLWNYGAPVSALEINDGTLFVQIRPGATEGGPAEYTVEPWASGFFQFRNRMTTAARGSKEELRVESKPGTLEFTLSGAIPADAQPHSIGLANPQQAEYAAALLKELLEARGIKVYGKAVARHATTLLSDAATGLPATVLAEHISLPLSEAVRVTAKVSQNLHAEMLLRDASREKTGDPTYDAAVKFAEDFRKSVGVTEDDVLMTDASGLSRRDLVTPAAVATLLRWAAQQPWFAAFRDSLPVAGEDGTLSDRMLKTPAADHVWAKTGTLGHVESLSGYATSAGGGHLVFSFFVNNHLMKTKPTEDALDALAVAMVEEFGKKPAAGKKPKKKL